MKRIFALALTAVFSTFLSWALSGNLLAAGLTPTVEMVGYGLYEIGSFETMAAGKSICGVKHNIENWKLSEKTDRVPAVKGTNFGFEFKMTGLAEGRVVRLEKKTITPGLTPPGASKPAYESVTYWDLPVETVNFIGYTFDYDWEAVPGQWTIQLYYEGQMIAEKVFTVYKP